MKLVMINNSDHLGGGATKAAYRLHRALLDADTDSLMLVQIKLFDDFTVLSDTNIFGKAFNLARVIIDRLPTKVYKHKSKTYFNTSWLGFNNIITKINKIKPDIVHLHLTIDGTISIEDIAKINCPIVWSLHDMWPFTGGCHYDEGCGRYVGKCGYCKVLKSKHAIDLSSLVYYRKLRTFSKIKNMTFIGLSRWITECAVNSTIVKNSGFKVVNLPNLINTDMFKIFDKNQARNLWNLSKDKKVVVFGALKPTDDPRKGYNELNEALTKVSNKNHEVVVFGSSKPKDTTGFGFKIRYVGWLNDEISLVTLYNAADVVVVPSLQENLANVIMESLACGTPVVAFDIGGNKDLIEHKANGYLAKPYDTDDLKNGIEWVINNEEHERLRLNSRNKVLREFDSKIVVQKYINLYKEILSGTSEQVTKKSCHT